MTKKIGIIILGLGIITSASAFDVISKRGETSLAPENSVEAIRKAWDGGAKFVECDFHLTKSGKIVCVNSERELKELSACKKKIKDLTDDDIKKISLSATKRWNKIIKTPVPLPTIDDIMKTVPERGTLIAEIKTYGDDFAKKFEEARKNAGLPKSRIIITGTDLRTLVDFMSKSADYRYFWSFFMNKQAKIVFPAADDVIAKCKETKIGGVVITNPKVVAQDNYISELKKAGLTVYVSPINTIETLAEVKNAGADGIYSHSALLFINKYNIK